MRVLILRNNVLLSAGLSEEDLAHSWTDVPGKYARGVNPGGVKREPSLLACKSLCQTKPSCLAVDYANATRLCFWFSTLVPHDQLHANSGITHSSKGNEKGMVFFSLKNVVG